MEGDNGEISSRSFVSCVKLIERKSLSLHAYEFIFPVQNSGSRVSDTKGYFIVYSFLFLTFETYLIYYLCAFREVAKAVARIIALALDLEVGFFDKPEMLGEPIATLRLLHYEGKILLLKADEFI